MNPSDLTDPDYILRIDDDDWNNVWVRNSNSDWVYQYKPEDDGTDGVRVTGQSELTSDDKFIVKGTKANIFMIDAPFFIKNANANLWIDLNHSSHDLVYKFNFGLYTISNNNISQKYKIPEELPDGTLLEDALDTNKRGHYHFQLVTDVAENTIEIRINNIGYGTFSLSDLELNNSQRHYFGFNIRSTTNDVGIIKAIVYKTSLDTSVTLTRSRTENRFSTNDKIQYNVVLKDEYGKFVQDKLRLYCNNTHVSFDTSDGTTVKEEGTRYFNTFTDFYHGRAYFYVYNVDDTSASFDVQAHISRNYDYNYSISEGIRSYYQTQPTIDTSAIDDEYWYSNNKSINIISHLVDNHGNQVTTNYKGTLSINDIVIANNTWDGSDISYTIPKTPIAPNYNDKYILKWTFPGNSLYYPVEVTKTVTVKKAKLKLAFSEIKNEYNYPEKISFKINVTCDNPTYSIPTIKAYRNNTQITLSNNIINDTVNGDGLYNYSFTYDGNDKIGALYESKAIKYNMTSTKINISSSNEYYVGQQATITARLVDDTGNPLSNKTLKAQFTITDAENNITTYNLTKTTNSKGYVTFEYTYQNDNDQIGATADVIIKFNGDGINVPTESYTDITWKKKEIAFLQLQLTNPEAEYPEEISLKGTFRNEGDSTENIEGITVKCIRNDGVVIGTATTNSRGIVYFTDIPSHTLPGQFHTYQIIFEGDESHTAIESNKIRATYTKNIYMEVYVDKERVRVGDWVNFEVELWDDDDTLPNKYISVDIKGIKSDGTIYNPENSVTDYDITTNSQGIAETEFFTNIAGTYYFTFTSSTHPAATKTVILEFEKKELVFYSVSETNDIDYYKEGKIQYQAQDTYTMQPLANVKAYARITFEKTDGGMVFYEKPTDWKLVTSDSNGYFPLMSHFLQYPQGDIIGKFEIKLENDDTYEDTSEIRTVRWNKVDTTLSLVSNTGETDVTTKGSVVAILKDKDGNHVPFLDVKTKITWKNTENQTVSVKGIDETGIIKADNNGEIISSFTPTNRGDIIGTITFTFDGTIVYNPSSFTAKIKWNKISTEIIAEDVTIYNGRYTNLERTEINWSKPSPGEELKYKNFHAQLKTVNTNSNFITVPGAYLQYINYMDNVLFETEEVDREGYVNSRWTRTYKNVPASYEIYVIYSGNDLFKPTRTPLMFNILKRVETSLTEYVYETNPPNIRYNVPFNFGAILKAETEPLPNQEVIISLDGEEVKRTYTNSSGAVRLIDYVIKDVKTCVVKAEYDIDDMIDKYIPSTLTYNIIVQKDFTTLTSTIGTKVYTSCGNALVKFTLVDSLGRGIADKIYMKYDDGTYKSPKWLSFEDVEYVSTNTNGKAEYHMKSYSGIRLIKGTFNETWCYLSSTTNNEVEYDISRVYTTQLIDGKAQVNVDCYLGESSGLPNGLYDVKIEYIPPEAETGKCQLYASSETVQPLRKKNTAQLTCLTEDRTTEAGVPLFLTTKLTDIKNEALPNEEINSKIDGLYQSIPNHITTTNGEIERGYTDKKINYTNNYNFKFNQTREYASANLDVETHTTKIKPIIETEPTMITYSGIDTTLEATVYYVRKKYDTYGQEIKKSSDGKEIYHNPLAKNNPNYPEYYYIENKTKIETTKQKYDNAESQTTVTLLKNKEVIWTGSSGVTVLARATTNNEGKATVKYHRNTANTVTIYAKTEEDETYLASSTPIQMTTIARIETYFVEPIPSGKTTQETIYHHSTTYGAYLKYKDPLDNNKEKPLANQEIIFRKGSVEEGNAVELGKATTNSNGYASITYKEDSYKVMYEVIFRGNNEFIKSSDIFAFKVNPQTPQLTITLSKTEIDINESVQATIKFKEDTVSGAKPISTNKIRLTEITPDNKIRDLGFIKTDVNGEAKVTVIPSKVGNVKIKATCDHESLSHLYNPVNAEATVQVKKIATTILENTRSEDDGNDMIVTLIETKSKKVIPFQKIKFYDGTTYFTESETNSKGIATGNGAFLTIGTHTVKALFEETDLYYSSNLTYNLEAKFLIDTCNDIRSWQVIEENWYASDGTSKYGMDTNKLNQYPDQQRRCTKYDIANVNAAYKCNCSPVNEIEYKNYRLRTYCDDLKTKGYQDNNGIHAPTGVVLRNKYIKTSNNCVIKYKLMVKYNGINNNTPGKYPIPNQFGGHMGLMKENATTAEGAKVRFEIYRKNSYCMVDGQIEQKWNGSRWVDVNNVFAYKFEPNTWYTVTIDITAKTVEYSIAPLEGSCAYNFKEDKVVENLYPYIFAFTNGTEFVLREMKIEYRQ